MTRTTEVENLVTLLSVRRREAIAAKRLDDRYTNLVAAILSVPAAATRPVEHGRRPATRQLVAA